MSRGGYLKRAGMGYTCRYDCLAFLMNTHYFAPVCVCRFGSSSVDSISDEDTVAAAAAAAQRLHLERLAAAMRYSPYHLTPHPCLPLPGHPPHPTHDHCLSLFFADGLFTCTLCCRKFTSQFHLLHFVPRAFPVGGGGL